MRLLARHLAFRLVVTVVGAATAVLLVVALLIGLFSIKRTEQIVADDLTRQQLIMARSSRPTTSMGWFASRARMA